MCFSETNRWVFVFILQEKKPDTSMFVRIKRWRWFYSAIFVSVLRMRLQLIYVTCHLLVTSDVDIGIFQFVFDLYFSLFNLKLHIWFVDCFFSCKIH